MGHIKITKCTIDRRDKNLAQASTIAVVLERQHTALGEIVQVFWPFACFGQFSFFCLFVYRSPMNFGEVSSWNHCWWLVVNPNPKNQQERNQMIIIILMMIVILMMMMIVILVMISD